MIGQVARFPLVGEVPKETLPPTKDQLCTGNYTAPLSGATPQETYSAEIKYALRATLRRPYSLSEV